MRMSEARLNCCLQVPDLSQSENSGRALIELYRNTHYDVRLPGGRRITVRIGQSLPTPLCEFLGNAANAHLVSACNPFSVATETNTNRRRMHDLVRTAEALKLPILAGVGHIPGEPWRESFLLLASMDIGVVDTLARRFGQNAVVSLLVDQPARLRIYQNAWRQHTPDSADIEWAADATAPAIGISPA